MKKAKKLLQMAFGLVFNRRPRVLLARDKGFLVLFFKKELLPFSEDAQLFDPAGATMVQVSIKIGA